MDNMEEMNIELGMGVLGVEFGMSRKEVEKILGKPSEIEKIAPEAKGDGAVEAWHYDELELSATFDELEDWQLIALSVSSPDFMLEGIDVIGLSQQEVIQQIELLDIGEIEIEEMPVDDDDEITEHLVATVEDAGLNIWFEDGIATEIQWGPIWDEDEEE
jgi:hypothetical protein